MQLEIPPKMLLELRERTGHLPDEALRELALAMLQMGLRGIEFKRDTREPKMVDQLTGCLTYRKFIADIQESLKSHDQNETVEFLTNFLCLNIKQFKSYVDRHGMKKSDEALASVGRQLLASEHDVYRAGGEKFIVRYEGQQTPAVPEYPEIEFRRALVKISVKTNAAEAWHFLDGILWYCDKGLQLGSLEELREFELRHP